MPKNEENKHINKYKLKFAQQYDKLLGFNRNSLWRYKRNFSKHHPPTYNDGRRDMENFLLSSLQKNSVCHPISIP